MIRHQESVLKKFQGQKFEKISVKVRDKIIQETILIQEDKYIENMAKFKKQLAASKDARQRACSKILKYYSDDFVMNQRTLEQESELIKTQIDGCLPLVDPSRENFKKEKSKVQKRTNPNQSKNANSIKNTPVKNLAVKKVQSSDNGNASKSSIKLNFDRSELSVLKESQEVVDEEDTDSELELKLELEALNHQSGIDNESITLDELETRRYEAQVRLEKKKKKIEEQEFLNQLRMFSLLTPSMEFIPEFKDMIGIM